MTIIPVETIRDLVRELLRHGTPSTYGAILSRYTAPSPDLTPYFRWDPRHYTRACIQRNDAFELLVVCYEPGQRTSIHDFNSQMAWVQPVMGEVEEERFHIGPDGELRPTSVMHLHPGQIDRFSNVTSIHRFTNRGPGRAVTLNLYAKPMSQWRVYDERTGTVSLGPAGPPA